MEVLYGALHKDRHAAADADRLPNADNELPGGVDCLRWERERQVLSVRCGARIENLCNPLP